MKPRTFEQQQLRVETEGLMTCRDCNSLMLIVDGFRVCENGCGRLLPTDRRVRKAWPERLIVARKVSEMAQDLRI